MHPATASHVTDWANRGKRDLPRGAAGSDPQALAGHRVAFQLTDFPGGDAVSHEGWNCRLVR